MTVFSGVRKSIGVRVDTGLWKAAKPILIERYGSCCRPFEAFLVAHLAAAADPASLGHSFKIEHLHIERNLRPRRKLPADVKFDCDEVLDYMSVVSGQWEMLTVEHKVCWVQIAQAHRDTVGSEDVLALARKDGLI